MFLVITGFKVEVIIDLNKTLIYYKIKYIINKHNNLFIKIIKEKPDFLCRINNSILSH